MRCPHLAPRLPFVTYVGDQPRLVIATMGNPASGFAFSESRAAQPGV
jgi:hypothetical protein